MAETVRLKLPLLEASQSQKHVTHNEALVLLDLLTGTINVVDRGRMTPPGSGIDGDIYILGDTGTGEWAGFSKNDLAIRIDGGWRRVLPQTGMVAFVNDENAVVIYVGGEWREGVPHLIGHALAKPAPADTDQIGYRQASDGALVSTTWGDVSAWLEGRLGGGGGDGGGVSEQDLADGSISLLGINTAADSTNRLAVKSDGVLISHDDVTPGSGDARITVNKGGETNDASISFQDGWSTRGLIGLLGDNSFGIKVSPDGSIYKDALTIDKDSGQVSFPEGSKFSAYMVWGGPDQWIGADSWTKVGFNNSRHNDQSAFDASDNSFTAPADGCYLFGAKARFRSDGTDPTRIRMGFSINLATPTPDHMADLDPSVAPTQTVLQLTALLKLNGGDKVYVLVNFTGQDGYILDDENYFWGHRVA